MHTLIAQGPTLTDTEAQDIAKKLAAHMETRDGYFTMSCEDSPSTAQLEELRQLHRADMNILPRDFDAKSVKLLITDMDSTFINIECIDEIADHMGIKPQVAAITEAAMRGELDFAGSLTKRVALLKGLDVSALEDVYHERLRLNPGGEAMIAGLKKAGIKIGLVSGGFTMFTDKLKARYGLDFTRANTLDITADKLTGRVLGEIIGAEQKAAFLSELCRTLAIAPSQVVAMGDGANDLLMMQRAGLSIAYHAKPKVQAQAATQLNYCGLEGVLGLLRL